LGKLLLKVTQILNARCIRDARPEFQPLLLTPTRAAAERYTCFGQELTTQGNPQQAFFGLNFALKDGAKPIQFRHRCFY
jgi:hypothetical protein